MARLEVDVLGPFALRLNGVLVEVPSRRQRALLAALALQAGQAVAGGRLAVCVWDERPPQHVAPSLYTLVNRTRRLIGDDAIRTASHGYQLDITPDRVDALRMQRLMADAQGVEPGRARVLLGEALALWRGDPLRDCGSERLERELTPLLTEHHLTCLERCVDLDLTTGGRTPLTAELRKALADHPLREPLWARLVAALNADGRPAEALEAYETIRRHLAERLGTDPSPELRTAHAQALAAGDPAIRAPSPVPRQLPPGFARFVGRRDELALLDRLMTAHQVADAPPVVVALHGPGGAGKTTLALRWAHKASESFPDGQLFLDMRGHDAQDAVTPAAALDTLLRALDVPPKRIPTDVAACSALMRTRLAGRRTLLLIDNVRDADQVRPLLPGPGHLVLITSRNDMRGLAVREGASRIGLSEMTEAEARDLVAATVGAERVAAAPAMVSELLELCGRLPLALVIAAQRAALYPSASMAELVEELRADGSRLEALADPADPATDLRMVFSWSYRALSPRAAVAFRRLGLHPGARITLSAAAALLDETDSDTRRLLDVLAANHLLEHDRPGVYRFHDLLRVYATELSRTRDTEAERRTALHRLLDHYLRTAHDASLLVYPHRHRITLTEAVPGVTPKALTDQRHALDWLLAESEGLLAAVRRAAETGFDVHAWQLAWALVDFLDRQGHWQALFDTQRLALESAGRLGDLSAQAQANAGFARALIRWGRNDDALAHLNRALALFAQMGNRVGQARAHGNIAWVLELLRRPREALVHAQRGLELYRTTDDRAGLASALNSVGWRHAQVGEYHEAIRHCRQALELHQELGNRRGQADTWDSLGYAHHLLGHHAEAVTCYEHTLRLYGELGNRYQEAESLARLGQTHHAAGNHRAARRVWQQALVLLDEIGIPDDDHVRDKVRRSLLTGADDDGGHPLSVVH